ncbi:MAG: hypothetical protein SPJ34_03780 [Candidatus Ornithospirochaeta sp.]|nr:hypothetical protein [Candidatus Ornithospirochaeta sp.]
MKRALYILLAIAIAIIPSCSEHNIYREGIAICRVGERYFDTIQEAVDHIALRGNSREISGSIPEDRTVRIVKDVRASEYDDRQRGGITVPSSFSGDLCIDFGGYTYEFSSRIETFFRFLGGSRIEVINGMTVIGEDSISEEKALIVGTRTVTIDEHIVRDLRSRPQSVEVTDGGNAVLKGEGTSLSGDFRVNGSGELSFNEGSYRIDSLVSDGTVRIYSGSFSYGHDAEEAVNSAISSVPPEERGEIEKSLVHVLVHFDAIPSQCTAPGKKEYWVCSIESCRKVFLDEDCTHQVTDLSDLIIPAVPHSLSKTERLEPTCLRDGYDAYWSCSMCGLLFSDEECSNPVTMEDLRIPRLPHSAVHHDETESTCLEHGVYEHWSCSSCGKLFRDEQCTTEMSQLDTVKPLADHAWHEGYQADSLHHWKVCSVCYQTGAEESHSREYGADEHSHWEKCSVCGYQLSEPHSHEIVVFNNVKYCNVCRTVLESPESEPGFSVNPSYPEPTGRIEVSRNDGSWSFTLIGTSPGSMPDHWAWYVDDELQEGASEASFAFDPPRMETYEIMCIFWNGSGYGSASMTINNQ